MAKLIDAEQLKQQKTVLWDPALGFCDCVLVEDIDNAPAVDAVVMPKGKPGDCLEFDNGTGFKQIYHIDAVMICKDCMRYDLGGFAPVINHPGILRILSIDEAKKEWREMCAKAAPREEPTLTAVCGEKKEASPNGDAK